MISQLTLADPIPALTGWGFPVTAREDGKFDVANTLEAGSEEAVLEVYHRLYYWPNWPGPTLGATESDSHLRCGKQEPYIHG
jgi:hypothetical protein